MIRNLMKVLSNLFGNNTKINANTIAVKKTDNTADTLDNCVIVDSGSNSNGSWIKWADGTMICYGYNMFTGINMTTQWGSMYETSNPLSLGDFPQPFVSRPDVFFMPWQTYFVERQYNSSWLTSWGAFYPCRATSATNWDVGISKLAIGKWK